MGRRRPASPRGEAGLPAALQARNRQLLAFRWRRFVRFALCPDVSAAAEPDLARDPVPDVDPVDPELDPELELGLLPLDRLELSAFVVLWDDEPLEVEPERDVPARP